MNPILTKVLRLGFCLCFLGVIGGFLLLNLGGALGIDWPEWMKANREESQLEGRTYQEFPELNAEGVTSGQFQQSFESYVSDSLPLRDQLMETNAALQRLIIAPMAQVFALPVYPTFFGSQYVYDPERDQVYPQIDQVTPFYTEAFDATAASINDFAVRNPHLNVYFAPIERIYNSPLNPTAALRSASVDENFYQTHLLGALNDSVHLIDLWPKSLANYDTYYFKTDHHFNMLGGLKAYETLIETMKPDEAPLALEDSLVEYDVPFIGSIARSALVVPQTLDRISDVDYDSDRLSVFINGEEVNPDTLRHQELYTNDDYNPDPYTNRYGEYFHGDYGEIEFINHDRPDAGSLLVVGDSYSNTFDWLLAQHYSRVVFLDPRHPAPTVTDTLAEGDFDDVLFLLCSENYTSTNFFNSLAAR